MKKLSVLFCCLGAMAFFTAPAHAGFITPPVAVPETGGTLVLLGITFGALAFFRGKLSR
jgi:hypothetical protein